MFWALTAYLRSNYGEFVNSRKPEPDVGPLTNWLRRGVGLVGMSVALAFWYCGPVRDMGGWSWWPDDYVSSMLAGLSFWTIGVFLLFYVPKAPIGDEKWQNTFWTSSKKIRPSISPRLTTRSHS
jgi:hypothetical protein